MAASKRKKAPEEVVPLQRFQGTKMEKLKQLYDQWYGCERCQLHNFRCEANGDPYKDLVFGEGNPDSKIMIIGEGPGAEEDATGVPFVGAAGRLLNQILAATSDNAEIQEAHKKYNSTRHTTETQGEYHQKILAWRTQEFFITNLVACRPPENRTPSNLESKACWERLLNIIYIVDPWFIIAAGKPTIEALTHKKVEVTKKRGEIFDVEIPGRITSYTIPVMATLHPSYLLRVADYKSKEGSFARTLRDYRGALSYVDGLKLRHYGTPIPYRPQPAKGSL
jgi:uracil-DNA glycosylase family 4